MKYMNFFIFFCVNFGKFYQFFTFKEFTKGGVRSAI